MLLDFLLTPFLAKECPPSPTPQLPPATLESFERPASCKTPSFSWMRFNEPLDRGFPRARNATLARLLGSQCQEDKAHRGSAWLLNAFLGRCVTGVRTRLGGSEGMFLPAPPAAPKQSPDPASKAILTGCGMQSFQKVNAVYQTAVYNGNGWPFANALFFFPLQSYVPQILKEVGTDFLL